MRMADATALPDVNETSDFRRCFRAFRPSPQIRTLDWARDTLKSHLDRPFDHAAYPHIGAPGGPFDALDDPRVRTVSQQFGAQVSKTFTAQAWLLKVCDTNPAPAIMASATETLAKEVTERTYEMIHRHPSLNGKLIKHEREQRQGLIEFRDNKVFVAWSRSVSTLGDKSAKYGHGGEIDKWEHASTSKEGHPLELFLERFKQFWSTRKVIFESTPSVRGKSAIERRRLAGTNCRYEVPCPHCRRYQVLEMGDGTGHGIRWQRPAPDRHDEELARETAYYECRHCAGRIENHHRPWMIRRGVWCPAGCTVIDKIALAVAEGRLKHEWRGWKSAPWIEGTPARDGEDASYQLSSLYSLALSWGDIAKKWVNVHKKPALLRNFINQWLAETWEVRKTVTTAEEVAKRLNGGFPRGEVPDDVAFLTVGIDVQADYFVWVVVGWGIGDRGYVVDYGSAATWAEIADKVLLREFRGKALPGLVPVRAGIDSGHRTDEVYTLCKDFGPTLRPTKGVESQEKPILPSNLEFSTRPGAKQFMRANQMMLWKFWKGYFQEELQNRLDSLEANAPGSLTLCTAAAEDEDFIAQLLNNAPMESESGRLIWDKLHESDPDDFRDAVVIAKVAKEMFVKGSEEQVATLLDARRNPNRTPAGWFANQRKR